MIEERNSKRDSNLIESYLFALIELYLYALIKLYLFVFNFTALKQKEIVKLLK